jgi:hypothetical protein
MAYTQIIYISRSTFKPNPASNGIEPNVARILAKSRVNNRKNGLVGVLYFGDGCFFQCLEGEEAAVDKLYQRLLHDDRHTDIKLLSKKSIDELSFADWSMKYVPLEDKMNSLLIANGYKSFNPYLFSTHMIEKVLELLFASDDYIFSPKVSTSTETEVYRVEIEKVKRLTQLALTISVIALGLGLANIIKAV